MSTEFAGMARAFAEHVAAAADALDRATQAGDDARVAERRAGDAMLKLADLKREMHAAMADREAHVRLTADELAAKVRESEDALAAHKKKHAAIVENSTAQVDQLSERLTGLQKEVGDLVNQRDALNAEIAGLKARFAESAAKL